MFPIIQPTIQQGPDEMQESWVFTDVFQSFDADANIIQGHQHQPAKKRPCHDVNVHDLAS